MRRAILLFWCLLAMPLAQPARAQDAVNLVVIVNAKSPITMLSAKEVADLYLGRSRSLGQVKQVIALDHPIASATRSRFYQELTGKDIAEVNAYWARLLFTGQNSPPMAMPDSRTIIDLVRKNTAAVGYLDRAPDDKGVRVVLTLPIKP